MNKNFKQASDKEREQMIKLFNQFGVEHYTFTDPDGYDQYDGCFTGRTGNHVVFEVKNRDCTSAKYDETVVEKSKVDFLKNETVHMTHEPIIFFFFTDNTCWIEKIKYDQYYSSWGAESPKTTMGNTEMVMKQFVSFPIDKKKLLLLN
ncbi:hypothetical protein ACNQGL_07615 [Flavobacterium sp. LB3P21]|uniref:hypothetical protein n=1 Tax=Flavobacterium sp. LB3P21 TaxID=3401719 RepID=UPI003AACD862